MTTKRIIVEQIDKEQEEVIPKYSSFDAFTDGISKGGMTIKDLILNLLVLFFISIVVIFVC